jgi:plasmid stability protein
MASLHIRDLDDALWQALAARARRQGRSLAREAEALLAEAVSSEASPVARRRALLADAAQGAAAWPGDLPEVEALLAEDRAR